MVGRRYDLAGKVLDTYSRISDDPNDLQRGVTRQQADTIAMVEELGASLGEEHPENDTSAYRKKRVTLTDANGNSYTAYRVIRPVWTEALHRLRQGEADGLVVYDLDRLARDPRDLEDAIEVVEHYGKVILSATASEIDLTTESGRMAARIMVVMANKSSADTGRRVKRAAQDTARRGVPVGWRTFGWQVDKVHLDPVESRLARQAADDLLSGSASLGGIARRWSDAGVLTVQGKIWRSNTTGQYFRNPRLAGYRTYDREILRDADGKPVMGLWEPLLGVETWERLVAKLTTNQTAGRSARDGSRKYLLTGILRCGICMGPMYGNADVTRSETRFYYRCLAYSAGGKKHTNSIGGAQTDSAITGLTLAHAKGVAGETGVEAFSREAELLAAQDKVEELMAAYDAGTLSGARVFPRVQKLEEELAVLANERTAWLASTTGPRMENIAQHWDDEGTTLEWRRAAIAKAFSAIIVKPSRGLRTYDIERLDPVVREL